MSDAALLGRCLAEQERSVDREEVDCADLEEMRIRQSECIVDTGAVQLDAQLAALGLLPGADALGGAPSCSTLPTPVVAALAAYVRDYQREMETGAAVRQQLEQRAAADSERLADNAERLSKVKADVAHMSQRSGAEFEEFRTHLKNHSENMKYTNREIADATRKREKAEMDARRTGMEMEKLHKIAKHVK